MKTIEKNIPELRFPEFDGKWQENRLGEIARFSKGKGISKDNISEDGKNVCIRYGELYTHYNEIIGEIISRTNVNKRDLVMSEKNDVIIPASGESSIDIAKASCVLRDGVALGGDLNIIKTNLNGVFLAYCLNHKKKKDIARLSQGISVVHLYHSQLKLLKIKYPKSEEQDKITDFILAIDDKIQQLNKKKTLLEQYKKGVMQKIFSQQIQFKDDNGKNYPDWEEKKLGAIAEKVNEKNATNMVRFVLTNSASQGIVSQQDYFDKDIANQENLGGYYIVKKDDFVYNPRISNFAPVGPIKRNKLKRGIMSPLYMIFRFTVSDVGYFEYYFETSLWHKYMKRVANYGARHDRMNIVNDDFLKMPIFVPRENEEIAKIVNMLNCIQAKIEQVSMQLNDVRTFKKGLLQQMFV